MVMQRRSFVKGLAATPAMFLTPHSALANLNASVDDTVDIYLFGLFLMEFQGENLVLVTPKYEHHRFCIVYSDLGYEKMPEYINLWDRLLPGKKDRFCDENLKFPAKAIANNGYVLDPNNPNKHKHRCTMVLPKPSDITVQIQQDSTLFHPEPQSSIGKLIQKEAGKKLGSVTHLQYKSRTGKSSAFAYVVSHHPLSLHTVNGALRSARNPCGQGFDLKMHDIPKLTCGGMGVIECPDWSQLTGLLNFNTSDNKSPSNLCSFHVDVASCPQFGIHG